MNMIYRGEEIEEPEWFFQCQIHLRTKISEYEMEKQIERFLSLTSGQPIKLPTKEYLLSLTSALYGVGPWSYVKMKITNSTYFDLLISYSPRTIEQCEKTIPFVSNLLNWLWEQKIPAVASCFYVNDLPYQG